LLEIFAKNDIIKKVRKITIINKNILGDINGKII